MYTDGAQTGLGATLLEEIDGQHHVVGYSSRTTSEAEKKYSATELELCAIAFALKSFHYLLFNPKPFNLFTDHHAIIFIMAGKSPPATKKISKLVSFISQYNFDLYHVRGEDNAMADFLSRSPVICHRSDTIPELLSMVKGNETATTAPPRRSPRLAEKAEAVRLKAEAEAVKLQSSSSAGSAQPITSSRKPRVKRVKPDVETQMTKSDSMPASTQDSRSNTVTGPVSGLPRTSISEQLSPTTLPPLSLIKPAVDPSSISLPRPDVSKPVDLMNYETFGDNAITYLPESKSLFDNENIDVRFSDRFRGSVPVRTRNKIHELALKDYKLGVTKDDIKREQRLDPYFRDLIAYLQHRILPTNKQHAKIIISQEEHYCLIGDILFRLPRSHDVDDDSKLRL